MSRVNEKNQAKVIQARMKELGYPEFKLGHAQELIATLNGEKSWNVLSAKESDSKENTKQVLENVKQYLPNNLVFGDGPNTYTVKKKAVAEVATYITVKASSQEEALQKAALEDDSIPMENWKAVYVLPESQRVTDLQNTETKEFLEFEENFQYEISQNLDRYQKNKNFYGENILNHIDLSPEKIAMVGAVIPFLLENQSDNDDMDTNKARLAYHSLCQGQGIRYSVALCLIAVIENYLDEVNKMAAQGILGDNARKIAKAMVNIAQEIDSQL